MKAFVFYAMMIVIALSIRGPCVFGVDVRLIGGPDRYSGRVEVRHDGVWGTVCDDGWDIQDATVVCRMLGFENASMANGYASYGEGSGSIFLDNINCSGLETELGECSHNGFEVHNCQHYEDAGVVCSENDQQVRLVGGQTALEGRVEVFFNGSWGTVCDDAWDSNDARIVCIMLGFQTAVRAVTNAEYGEGSGSIILDNVGCLGTERKLAECSHNGYGIHNCGHSEDAGVVCADVRLSEIPDLKVRLVDGPNSREGRVELLYEGSWGTICDDNWDSKDAKVVCRMLGFNGALSAPRRSATYGQGSDTILLDDVACVGTENNLAECSHRGFGVHDCSHVEDAAAVCSIDTTSDHFEVRLVDGRSKNEGRVEMFYNTSWGTLCGAGWGLREADVVCTMLGFTDASDVPQNAAFGEGVGMSVFLKGISCLGSENSLTDCTFIFLEANSCPHNQDVGVICKDTGALISKTKINSTTSLGHPEHIFQGSTVKSVSSAENFRTLSPVSIVLGSILAASYALFLLVGLYGCHRLRKLEMMTVNDLSEQPTSKGTGSPEAASAYLNLTSLSKKSTETLGKEAPGELQYMDLEVPENTTGGDQVYEDMSFTKGNDQEGPSRKYKAPIRTPVGHKPKSGRLESPDRIHHSPLTQHDPIYDECD